MKSSIRWCCGVVLALAAALTPVVLYAGASFVCVADSTEALERYLETHKERAENLALSRGVPPLLPF